MSYIIEAESRLRRIHNDTGRFGWPFTLTDPNGVSKSLNGLSNDISAVYDPDTGMIVSGRSASISICIEDIKDAGFDNIPWGVADTTSKPWTVVINRVNYEGFKFKISKTMPDYSAGNVICILEVLR